MRSPQLALLLAIASCLLLTAQGQERYKRLTTFGKAPEKQNHPGTPIQCRNSVHCPTYSSCKEDPYGRSTLCICDDGAYPVGRRCKKFRVIALRKPCQSSTECISGAECKINPNATTAAGQKTKVCLCTEDTIEEDNECSGCIRLQKSEWLLFILGLSSLVAFQH